MALADPRGIYGVHSVTPYRRSDNMFYGTLRVVKGSTLSIEGSTTSLMGGASKFPWAVEQGEMKVELSLKFAEYADFLFELFLGNAPTQNVAEASGFASDLTNVLGTSVFKATTGIADVTVTAASDLKLAKYVVKAQSATTVHVYASSDVDFSRGSNLTFQDETLRITATPLTIATGAPVVVPGTGVSLTGGSGVVAFTVGDTATFETRPVNTKSMSVRIGGSANQTMPEFGCIVMAQKRGNNEMTELDCFRCLGAGMPLGFDQNAWSEAEVKVAVFYDSVKDGVFDFRHVSAT